MDGHTSDMLINASIFAEYDEIKGVSANVRYAVEARAHMWMDGHTFTHPHTQTHNKHKHKHSHTNKDRQTDTKTHRRTVRVRGGTHR